ncbi:MAG: hypothetical protein ACRC7I_03005 [Selenomonadaceae bacterium]
MFLRNKILRVIFLSSCCLMLFCSIAYAGAIEDEHYSGSTYHNDYLGFYIQFPSDWHLLNESQNKDLIKRGIELYSGNDVNLKNALTASEDNDKILVHFIKYPLGAPYNISAVVEAVNVENYPYLQNGENFLEAKKIFLLNTPMTIEFEKDIHNEEIDGIKCTAMVTKRKIGKIVIKQKTYVIFMKEYAVEYIFTYTLPKQEKEVDDIFKSLRFNK